MDGSIDHDIGMRIAASKGSLSSVEEYVRRGARDWEGGMRCSVVAGSISLVEFFIAKGARDFNSALIEATLVENVAMAELFISKGASNFHQAVFEAIRGNTSMVMIEFLIPKCDPDNRYFLDLARKYNRTEIIEYLERNI